RLDNGVTVLVRENPLAPVVAVALLVRMGTRWERAENDGISNFVHAVMVKGTARRSGADLAEAVAGLGGKLTASGEVDYSGIQASALARFWRELIGLTAEVALTPKLEPADVDGERDWLLSRIQRQRDNPVARTFDELYAAACGFHPYGLPTLGTPRSRCWPPCWAAEWPGGSSPSCATRRRSPTRPTRSTSRCASPASWSSTSARHPRTSRAPSPRCSGRSSACGRSR